MSLCTKLMRTRIAKNKFSYLLNTSEVSVMEATTTVSTQKRCAVVTGANRGIGFEICWQLASNGIAVILTARDEKRGIQALQTLETFGLSDVIFHQLDVQDSTSIASLAKFVQTNFGKLDILVNNAADSGLVMDNEAFLASLSLGGPMNDESAELLKGVIEQTYEYAEVCLKTNYYGAKEVTKALLPLLQLSGSPRIVNISSHNGELKHIYNEEIKAELGDVESLTDGKIDEIIARLLGDFKDGKLEGNGWPRTGSAYKVSKAALNAYTRILAREFPDMIVNCVHPGYVQTGATFNTGDLTAEEGAKSAVMLALLPDGASSGFYYDGMCPSYF